MFTRCCCCCYFCTPCDLFGWGGGGGLVSTPPPFPLPKWWHPAHVDPWTLSACPLFTSLWVFKTEELKVTPGRLFECAYAHAHSRAIDGFGLHSHRVNRVTSFCLLLSVKAVNPRALCYISGHLHDIRCPLPASPAHRWNHDTCLLCPLLWRWRGGDFQGRWRRGQWLVRGHKDRLGLCCGSHHQAGWLSAGLDFNGTVFLPPSRGFAPSSRPFCFVSRHVHDLLHSSSSVETEEG